MTCRSTRILASPPLHSERAVNNLGLIQQVENPATFHAMHILLAY
jgi:hypothetical protein